MNNNNNIVGTSTNTVKSICSGPFYADEIRASHSKRYYFDERADAPIAKPVNARFGGAFYEPSADRFIYIERVVYNNPNTIVIFSDGTRTTCTCNNKDNYDREKGLLICVMKRMFGSDYVMNLMGDWAFGDKITLCLRDVRAHQNNK